MSGTDGAAPRERIQGRVTRSQSRGMPPPEQNSTTPTDSETDLDAASNGTADEKPKVTPDDEERELQERLTQLNQEIEQRRARLRQSEEAAERERRKAKLRARIAQAEAIRNNEITWEANDFLSNLEIATNHANERIQLLIRTMEPAQPTPKTTQEILTAVTQGIEALKQHEFPRQNPNTEPFKGRSIKELRDWTSAMEAHFEVFSHFYTTDDKKIRRSILLLDTE
ncbi:hypothetical protein BJX63DRAFT_438755 [Aspergillus granulosus]|uniref:Uncharacterized protein n=1 Tax=Aspergillus granulosus TaxID=176169 RepID=A0ABR4GRL9_9EURO